MSKKDFKTKIAKKKARSVKKAAETAKEPKKGFWQKLFSNKKRTIIIASVTVVVLIAGVVLGIVLGGGAKNKNAEKVKITDDFSHVVPKGFSADDIITMKNEETAKDFLCRTGGYAGVEPEPYDKGWYIYDEDAIARRYKDEDGKIHALPVADYRDATLTGVPLQILGSVKMHFIVYRGEEVAEACYMYFILNVPAEMDFLEQALDACGLPEHKKVSDTVVEIVMDRDLIQETLEAGLLVEEAEKADTLTNFLTWLGKFYEVKR